MALTYRVHVAKAVRVIGSQVYLECGERSLCQQQQAGEHSLEYDMAYDLCVLESDM